MISYKLKANPYKLIVLVGPTSSGKSELAVSLAKKFNGEIISADSRQIYKGMNLGTGKVAGNWQTLPFTSHPERSEGSLKPQKYFVYKTIPHHLIDFVNPKQRYSVSEFQKQAQKTIANILKRGHLPILCGGTAHWVDAVVFNQPIPDVKPNLKLRKQLEKKSVDALYKQLAELDPTRAANIDRFNKHRLIRAVEIVLISGKPVPLLNPNPLALSPFDTLWLGINLPQPQLYKKIQTRLSQRLKQGMVKEVAHLRAGSLPLVGRAREGGGLSWKKLMSLGLEYKFISLYLQKKLTYDEMFSQLLFAIKHYSKRQITWWKRNKKINWIRPDAKLAVKTISKFLKS